MPQKQRGLVSSNKPKVLVRPLYTLFLWEEELNTKTHLSLWGNYPWKTVKLCVTSTMKTLLDAGSSYSQTRRYP